MKVAILDSPTAHGKLIYKLIKELVPDGTEVELVTVTDKGGCCTNDRLCQGLVYCLFNDVDIINISLGLDYMSEEVDDIINKLCDKGVKVVCASGNGHCCYPALHPRTISVGALDDDGNVADYTIEGSYDVLEIGRYGDYIGTSFACARYVSKLVNENFP